MATQTETRVGVYEAMFLANQGAAASFGDLISHINNIFGRADAEVISMKKWDERRLSFEIDKQKRGVYILAYFSCPTDMVSHIERDVTISDKLMRVLITSADHLSAEEISAHDDRAGLETETKLRAQQGAAQDSAANSKVSLGAPVAAEAPAPAASAPAESDDSDDQDTDTDND